VDTKRKTCYDMQQRFERTWASAIDQRHVTTMYRDIDKRCVPEKPISPPGLMHLQNPRLCGGDAVSKSIRQTINPRTAPCRHSSRSRFCVTAAHSLWRLGNIRCSEEKAFCTSSSRPRSRKSYVQGSSIH
jgi:hypothetical protein